MTHCPTCAATYPPGTRFCRLDGTPLVGAAEAPGPRVRPLTVRPLAPPPDVPPPPIEPRPTEPSALDTLALLLGSGASAAPALPGAERLAGDEAPGLLPLSPLDPAVAEASPFDGLAFEALGDAPRRGPLLVLALVAGLILLVLAVFA